MMNLPLRKNIMNYSNLMACLLLLALGACKHVTPEEDDNKPYCITDSILRKSSIDTVKLSSVTNELDLSGKITFNEDNVVKVVALAGGHVEDVKVSLGDFVNEGQILAVVKSSDMAGYYNQFVSAKSDLAIAKKNLDVAQDFNKGGLNSEKDLVTAQKEYQKAQSDFNRINEIIKIYGGTGNADESTPATYYIKSPIAGFIVEKTMTTGMEIRPDDNTTLFTISGLKDVWVIANLYETDISKVEAGYSVEVSTLSYKDKSFTGKVDKVSNVLNPETKALNIRVRLENPDYLLKPGMFARITIHYPDAQQMLSVPKNSIVFDDNRNYVVKFEHKCDLKMQAVNIVKTFGDRAFIERTSDLKQNDRIITKNALFIFTALKKL
jgi:cobalt-zinc-cadmium efflux system membrane fusion protein